MAGSETDEGGSAPRRQSFRRRRAEPIIMLQVDRRDGCYPVALPSLPLKDVRHTVHYEGHMGV